MAQEFGAFSDLINFILNYFLITTKCMTYSRIIILWSLGYSVKLHLPLVKPMDFSYSHKGQIHM